MKPFNPDQLYKRRRSPWYSGVTLSLLAMFVLACMVAVWYKMRDAQNTPGDLVVYCAAGIRLPVEAAAAAYEKEFGVRITLDYDSSGALEGKLQLDRDNNKSRADLYVPADVSFATRARQKGLTAETLPLAAFRLVLAASPGADLNVTSLDQFLSRQIPFTLCDVKAGVGKTTRAALQNLGKWEAFDAAKKTSFPRVTDAAAAIQASEVVQAGFLWDTTARQFGLAIIELPELASVRSTISANVTAGTAKPTQALHFARYLASPEKGQHHFAENHFTVLDGDPWENAPELKLYCGGVNREAVTRTLRDFEKREGCKIIEQFQGCGALVATIKTIGASQAAAAMPDAFLTCDASYMTKVQNHFGSPEDVSSTNVVLLVRKGNPKNLLSLADLAKPGLSIGTTDPTVSTLGDLSWQMLDKAGVSQTIKDNDTHQVTTPTAHELILQMESHPKLDVALVYLANCQNLSTDKFDTVPIQDPLALAIQNVAVAKSSRFPQLTGRLIEAITSATSRQRFEQAGFEWENAAPEE